MFRSFVVLVVFGSWASGLMAAEPLDLKSEMGIITGKFFRWTFQNQGVRQGPEYEKVLAERNAALAQLAAKAEAAQSTDHLALAELYSYLDRNDDATREARAAIQPNATNLGAQSPLLGILCNLKLADDALTLYRQWLALDATELKAYLVPLESFPSGVKTMVKLLAASGRNADAEQALKEMDARLDKLSTQFANIPASPGQPANDVTIFNARIAVTSMRLEMKNRPPAGANVRPPRRQPPTPTGNPHAPDQMPRRQQTPYPPFRIEMNQIVGKFQSQYSSPQQRHGVRFEKDLAARNEALNQLAARMAAEQSTDHLMLATIYNYVERKDDAVREAKAAVQANSNDLRFQAPLLILLVELQLADESLKAFRQWLALDVEAADLKVYLAPIETPRSAANQMANMLLDLGRGADAEQALKELAAKLDKLTAQLSQAQTPPRQPSVGELLNNARMMLHIAKNDMTVPTANRRGHRDLPQPSSTAPLSVTAELYRILRDYRMLVIGGHDPKTDPDYPSRRAACDKALNDLVARALEEKTVDHLGLVRVYTALERPADADRELQAVIQATGNDFKSLMQLSILYIDLERVDDALAASRRWLALDIAAADTAEYLAPFTVAQNPIPLKLLLAAGRYGDAEHALNAWEAQLDKLQARIDQAPDAKVPSPLVNVRNTIKSLRFDISEKKLARGVRRVNGRMKFDEPLNVAFEALLINREFQQVNLNDPEMVKKAIELRNDSLSQLAAAAETAKSTEHSALANIYFSLRRYNDAAREAQAAVNAKAMDLACQSILIESLCRVLKQDEALAAFRQFVALDIPDSEVTAYLGACSNVAESMVGSLINSGKYAEAEKALNDLDSQIAKLKISPRQEMYAWKLKQLIPALRRQLNAKTNSN